MGIVFFSSKTGGLASISQPAECACAADKHGKCFHFFTMPFFRFVYTGHSDHQKGLIIQILGKMVGTRRDIKRGSILYSRLIVIKNLHTLIRQDVWYFFLLLWPCPMDFPVGKILSTIFNNAIYIIDRISKTPADMGEGWRALQSLDNKIF